jgi:hypothetical protein
LPHDYVFANKKVKDIKGFGDTPAVALQQQSLAT